MNRRLNIYLFIIYLTLAVSGCASLPIGGKQQPTNPLRGIELDLVFLDVMTTMNKVNFLLLNQMPISAEATWPSQFEPKKDKVYQDQLEKQFADDFSFFIYYGTLKNTDLFSSEAITERIITEAAKFVGKNVEHQINSIERKGLNKQKCEFFTEPLEEQIYSYALKNQTQKWIEAKINKNCLINVEALDSFMYESFNVAFEKVLPSHLIDSYKEAQFEYIAQLETQTKFESELSEKKNEFKKLKKNMQDTSLVKSDIDALKKQVDNQKKKVGNAEDVYKKLFEKALQTPEITDENVKLSEKLLELADIVNTNLNKAAVGATAVVAKAGFDVYNLIKDGTLDQQQIAVVMAQEIIETGKAKNLVDAQEMALKRVELTISRTVMFLPNVYNVYSQIISQKLLLGPKIKYLKKVIKGRTSA